MTGRTVAEALEQALDRLGVSESDAEVIVLEEAKSLMFGLRKTEARVRARVRPVQARAKRPARRQQRRPDSPRRASKPIEDRAASGRDERGGPEARSAARPRRSRAGAQNRSSSEGALSQNDHPDRERRSKDVRKTPRKEVQSRAKDKDMSVESQAQLAEDFVRGVVERFGLEAKVASAIEDDTIKVTVSGDGIGLLIGPRGATIEALQELTRTVVQRGSVEHGTRISVDVGGFRLRRAEALIQFAVRTASEVRRTGLAQALEPMVAADRKIVHDAVSSVEGVETTSEGEDPRRYVVIRPAEHTEDGSSADSGRSEGAADASAPESTLDTAEGEAPELFDESSGDSPMMKDET